MKNLLMGLCAMAFLLTSGCASFRVKTDLMPEADSALQSPAGPFYIAGLKYADASGVTPQTDANYEKALLSLVRKESIARYPLLFANDPANAIPLWIDVADSNSTKDKTLQWMLCTLMITPMILPMPAEMDRDIGVTIGVWNGASGMESRAARSNFHREEHAWTSLTPIALIPVPGESDLPKVSAPVNLSPEPVFHNRVGYNDAPQVAQQVATAIAKMVVTKDAAYWTAQPRRTGSLSSPAASPASVPAVALPLPTETVAPF